MNRKDRRTKHSQATIQAIESKGLKPYKLQTINGPSETIGARDDSEAVDIAVNKVSQLRKHFNAIEVIRNPNKAGGQSVKIVTR